MFKSILKNIVSKLYYFVASIIILLAIIITLARIFTPLINSHISFFEIFVGRVLNMHIQIKKIDAHWEGFTPEINLEDVNVLNSHNHPATHINNIQIHLDIFHSLYKRKLKLNYISLSGIHLDIMQLANKQWVVKGIVNNKSSTNKKSMLSSQNIFNWIIAQPQLVLHDINLDLHNLSGKLLPLQVEVLNMKNNGSVHVFSWICRHRNAPNELLNFTAQLIGNSKDPRHLKVDLYANVKQVNLSKWLQNYSFRGYHIKAGLLSGQFWLHWQNMKWKTSQSLIDFNKVQLIGDEGKIFKLQQLSGNLTWLPTLNGWRLVGDHIKVQETGKIWPKIQFDLTVNGKKQRILLNYFNISTLSRFLSNSNYLKTVPKKILRTLSPHGEVKQISLIHVGSLGDFKNYNIRAQFVNLSWNNRGYMPGVKNLSAKLSLSGGKGYALINGHNSKINFGKLFQRPFFLSKLSAETSWIKKKDGGWLLRANKVVASNSDINIQGKMSLLLSKAYIYFINHKKSKVFKNSSPIINISSKFNINNSLSIKYYLPMTIIPSNVIEWLNKAFVGGKGASGKIILHGPILNFPFDNNEGVFEVNSTLHHVNLHYVDGWPDIEDLNGRINFKNRRMNCNLTSGRIYNSIIKYFKCGIPYIGYKQPVVVNLDGRTSGDANDILNYLMNSPLHELYSKNVKQVSVHGLTNVFLKLNIPVNRPEKTKVQGKVVLSKAILKIPKLHLQLKEMLGEILFDRDHLWSHNLQAKLFGSAIKAKLETHANLIHIRSQGNIDSKKIQDYLPKFSKQILSGSCDYQMDLLFPTVDRDKEINSFTLRSKLLGLAIKLPPPLFKKADSSESFYFHAGFSDKKAINIFANFGSELSFAGYYKYNDKSWKFYSGDLHFGANVAKQQPREGLLIEGYLPVFNYDMWKKYFSDKMDSSSINIFHLIKFYLYKADLYIRKLVFFQRDFINSKISLINERNNLLLTLNNSSIIGKVIFPLGKYGSEVYGDFKRIWLNLGVDGNLIKINPEIIPPLNIHVDDFKTGGFDIGQINFRTNPEKNSLHLKSFSSSSDIFSVKLTGAWKKLKDGSYSSNVVGDVSSDNVQELLQHFSVNSSLIAKKGDMHFNLSWPDSLLNFKLSNSRGFLSLHLKNGWLIDLGKDTTKKLNLGRLVSLLSIRRLLMMNFDDLTHKGYGFDKMYGNFNVNYGAMEIYNLYFDGAVARIDVKGSVDFLKQQLDLRLIVAPYLTSSLPVVATIAAGPIAGIVTWVADKLVGKVVNKITRYHYGVSGDWRKPIIYSL